MAADPHHHGDSHTHDRPVTVVEDRDTGIGGVVAALMVAALIAFLIWLFAFSGVVFDRDDGDTGPQITNEQNIDEAPPGDDGGTTDGGTTDGGTTDGGTTDGTAP